MDEIEESSQRVQERNTGENDIKIGYLGGCAILLNLWLYEHTTCLESVADFISPRILKWERNEYKSRSYYIDLIKKLKASEVIENLHIEVEKQFLFNESLKHQEERVEKDLEKNDEKVDDSEEDDPEVEKSTHDEDFEDDDEEDFEEVRELRGRKVRKILEKQDGLIGEMKEIIKKLEKKNTELEEENRHLKLELEIERKNKNEKKTEGSDVEMVASHEEEEPKQFDSTMEDELITPLHSNSLILVEDKSKSLVVFIPQMKSQIV